ncbi:MAG: thioredoxin family protein [Verrucomicrobiota bacterium]
MYSKRMANAKNVAIVVIVVIAAAAAVVLKQSRKSTPEYGIGNEAAAETSVAAEASPAAQAQALPRLVDLGAHSCIPCKMMAPLLEELKKEYAGVFKTEFIDVWKDPEPGRKYGIRVIPTQIFFDAEGRELFRHEGFFGKEDILAKWKELGVDFTAN